MLDGVPVDELTRRWGGGVPHCVVVERAASALDVVHDLAARGALSGSVVIAEEQSAGRGRDGRSWHSPRGGVWLGVLLRPARPVRGGVLAVRLGLLVADAIDALLRDTSATPATTRIKWPNDVLLHERKVAGVLCEARWRGAELQWLAGGIGVNVANEIPAALRHSAAAIRELAPAARRIDLLDRLVPSLPRLAAEGEPELTEAECTAYARRDWLQGRHLAAPLAGRAAGVGRDGALLIETPAGREIVRDGHVELS